MNPWLMAGIGLLIPVVLMLVLWLIHLRTRNAGIVDAGWAGGLALIALFYAWAGGGYWLRAVLLAVMVGFWGLRLAWHLLSSRVIGHPEEGRYVDIRTRWKTNVDFKFLLFFEFQAVLCAVLSIPFWLAARNPNPVFCWSEWTAVGLWVVALLGESIADAQLEAFKRNPRNRGKTCQVGLWRFSRHPNYFFEWLIWCAFAMFALASPGGAWGAFAPLLMLYFVLFVTGIPPTEAQSIRSRGDEYRRYQQTTSAFFPWFPKKA